MYILQFIRIIANTVFIIKEIKYCLEFQNINRLTRKSLQQKLFCFRIFQYSVSVYSIFKLIEISLKIFLYEKLFGLIII
jgi:hypothetical protein